MIAGSHKWALLTHSGRTKKAEEKMSPIFLPLILKMDYCFKENSYSWGWDIWDGMRLSYGVPSEGVLAVMWKTHRGDLNGGAMHSFIHQFL